MSSILGFCQSVMPNIAHYIFKKKKNKKIQAKLLYKQQRKSPISYQTHQGIIQSAQTKHGHTPS